jgi:transposase-like protein
MCDLSNPIFHDADLAREHLESIRWPDGAICPHCGGCDRVMKLQGKSTRKGVYKCGDCRKQFTVTVGTVYERSHVPINKWIMATHLMCSSKKGISAHQLHRNLGVTYKTAFFMAHRIREAMKPSETGKLGGDGSYVEMDETYITNKTKRNTKKTGGSDKRKVITLVERNGVARSYHVNRVNSDTVKGILDKEVFKDSAIITDSAPFYPSATKEYAGHGTVNHSIREYVRGSIHTNTIEGFFSILKRGLNGVYQHCSKQHLKRYLAEYDFRYSYRSKMGYSDSDRTAMALKGIEGKRLTYLPVN